MWAHTKPIAGSSLSKFEVRPNGGHHYWVGGRTINLAWSNWWNYNQYLRLKLKTDQMSCQSPFSLREYNGLQSKSLWGNSQCYSGHLRNTNTCIWHHNIVGTDTINWGDHGLRGDFGYLCFSMSESVFMKQKSVSCCIFKKLPGYVFSPNSIPFIHKNECLKSLWLRGC